MFTINPLFPLVHDFKTSTLAREESFLAHRAPHDVAVIIPVTASDMRAEPFEQILRHWWEDVPYVCKFIFALGQTDQESDFRELLSMAEPMKEKAVSLWTTGPRMEAFRQTALEHGITFGNDGKGRSCAYAWALAESLGLEFVVMHDSDIKNGYSRHYVTRPLIPLIAGNWRYVKAVYHRVGVTDAGPTLNGRASRLLVPPLIQAIEELGLGDELTRVVAAAGFPLSGEMAAATRFLKTIEVAGDWGLEIFTLREIVRKLTRRERCQVMLGDLYDHKHVPLDKSRPGTGLLRTAKEVTISCLGGLGRRPSDADLDRLPEMYGKIAMARTHLKNNFSIIYACRPVQQNQESSRGCVRSGQPVCGCFAARR